MTTVRSPHSQPICDSLESVEGNVFVSAYPPFSCWTECAPDIDKLLESAADSGAVPWGIYVHLPFCLERCQFCYYRSVGNPTPAAIDSYLEALLQEFRIYGGSPQLADRRLTFVYFGGGTPSLLSPGQLCRLFKALQSTFFWDSVEEVTFECSPKTATSDRLSVLSAAGVTRISMGVQQMNDDVLAQSGRIHLVDDIRRAYGEIRGLDFSTVNIDLMVGLVGETEKSFRDSLDEVISMSPDSITLYQLEIPANTPLARAVRERRVSSLASWNRKRARLGEAFSTLEGAGYTVRSAYAAVRDPRRDTFLYQDLQYRGADLLGTGLSSFSYVANTHYQNVSSLREYCASLAADRLPCKRSYALSDEERAVREFVLQLKLGSVESDYFLKKFGINIIEYFAESLQRFSEKGWVTIDTEAVTLTRAGLLRVDHLLPAFYLPQHRDVSYW